MLLPVTLVCVLLLINKKRLMGAYTNGSIMNALAWATTVIMTILSLLLVLSSLGFL